MNRVATAVKHTLSSITLFSRLVLKLPLHNYQTQPAQAIIDSTLNIRGLEFLIIFPRQSGKNELIAQVLVYLLNLLQRTGGNIVYGATGDGLGRGLSRLEERLDNPWNGRHWKKASKPTRRILGKAAVVFISTHTTAASRGEVAKWLLVIDEMQDQVQSHIHSVFTFMKASQNATAVYLGTVKFTHDALWQTKTRLESLSERDGIQRVFLISPDDVAAENPHYRTFLDNQLAQHGRHHPIVASELYLEPIDGAGGLFPERRQALMKGSQPRQHQPQDGKLYIAAIDVGGQDEAATDAIAQLKNPGRDYTICTIFEIALSDTPAPGPSYAAVDVFVDHGSRHFQTIPGRPSLADRLNAYLDLWGVLHTICDESGVGEGLSDWLKSLRGETYVTGYKFSALTKAELGSSFLAVIETGRFSYFVEEELYSDAWWYWQQVKACRYEIKPEGRYERDLKWFVPASHRTDTPSGLKPTHDDRLLSASLISLVDELYRTGGIVLGLGKSEVIRGEDPLEDMEF